MTSTNGNRELCALASCRLLAPCCLWMAGGDWPGTCPQHPLICPLLHPSCKTQLYPCHSLHMTPSFNLKAIAQL